MSHVFVVDAQGTLQQVTGVSRSSAGTSQPDWSPDGTMLAFGPPKTGSGMTFEVGVVNADGSGERVVGEGQNPQWSPDGTRIVFEEVDDVTSEPRSMYMVDVASGEVTDIGQGFGPQWLADGERIGFQRLNADGTSSLVVRSLADGEITPLLTESAGVWSPDGSAVLLIREGLMWLAEPDGSEARELVDGYDPVWSPDGTRVVFAYDVNQNGVPLLAVVDLEGVPVWSGVAGATPSWSPDGTRLAVEVGVPTPVIRVLDAATGDTLWETDGADPAWAP
jgi:Tol biopolymer transport system component